jgi:hypothetical protein
VFLFWAVLVVAFLERGFQRIVRNCVELCWHAEKLCGPCRVIVRNCVGIVLRLCVEGGVWLVIFVRGRGFFVEHFFLFLFRAASAVAFAGQALQKSVQNSSPVTIVPRKAQPDGQREAL